MKMRIPFRPQIILLLLIAAIAMIALSTFFFIRLDQVVHGELYRYGLEFSYDWAGQYWTNSGYMMICLTIVMSLTSASIVFYLFYAPIRLQKIDSMKLAICIVLIIGVVATVSSAFFFNRLDHVVNNDLYKYGLQFNNEWAVQYWTYAKLTLTLIGLQIAITTVSILLISGDTSIRQTHHFISTHALSKPSSKKLTSLALLSNGLLALVFSINYASKILAFIGLGLILWGIILLYTLCEKQVKKTLLDMTTLSTLTDLNQIVGELEYEDKAVYLPTTYCRDFESSRVHISAQKDQKLLLSDKRPEEDGVFLKNPEGTLTIPPGMQLTKLFEKMLGTSFTKVNLQSLEKNMPKLLVKDLGMAQNVEIQTKNRRVQVRIEGMLHKNILNGAGKLSNINDYSGCLLCSAIACALTKTIGKPIMIKKEEQSQDGKTIGMEFNVVED